jgi:hypothetical protein
MTIWLDPQRYFQFVVMACVPNCDDPICDYVILLHCLALVIASLGGLNTGGWHKMEIIMMNSSMEMEIPKGTMGYTKSYMCLCRSYYVLLSHAIILSTCDSEVE